jgi:ABC-type nitrate/sulfonate/bicarbonate transport system permease component
MMAAANQMLRRHGVSLAVLFGMAVAWQALSMIYRAEALPGEPMVPGWQIVFTRTLISLSDYWRGGLGVKAVADGGEPSAIGGVLSILDASLDTIVRLYTGLAIGALFGGACGLAVSWSNWSRRLVALPLHLVRTLPLLAMVPLFQLWFGTYFVGKIIFIAYGVGVIFFVGVANAVRNVPEIYIDNALALGATRLRLYRTVILPAIFPELRSTVLLSLGTGWAATLGAEYLGAQSGLGYIIVYSEQFAYLDRMFLVALVIVAYACLSYAVFNRIALKALAWMPRGSSNIVLG